MDCDTYHELIVADIDDTLSASERDAVRVHLETCAVCRNARALEAEFAAFLRRGPRLVSAPAAVEARVRAALERAAPAHPRRPQLMAVAAGALLAVALTSAALRPSGVDFVRPITDDYRLALAARLPLDVITGDPRELARYFDASKRFTFPSRVLDLEPTGFHLVGGSIRERQGVVFAVSVYARDGEIVVCHHFADGRDHSTDAATETRRYLRARDLGVWVTRAGGVVCCLTTRMAPQEFERTVLAAL